MLGYSPTLAKLCLLRPVVNLLEYSRSTHTQMSTSYLNFRNVGVMPYLACAGIGADEDPHVKQSHVAYGRLRPFH